MQACIQAAQAFETRRSELMACISSASGTRDMEVHAARAPPRRRRSMSLPAPECVSMRQNAGCVGMRLSTAARCGSVASSNQRGMWCVAHVKSRKSRVAFARSAKHHRRCRPYATTGVLPGGVVNAGVLRVRVDEPPASRDRVLESDAKAATSRIGCCAYRTRKREDRGGRTAR